MTNVRCDFLECMYNENFYCQCEEIHFNLLNECSEFEIELELEDEEK